jgi:hypothetical protein
VLCIGCTGSSSTNMVWMDFPSTTARNSSSRCQSCEPCSWLGPFQKLMLLPLFTLAILTASAVAGPSNRLASRCIYANYDETCILAPIGLPDRWMSSPAGVQFTFSARCGYSVEDNGTAYFMLDDISSEHERKTTLYGMEGVDSVYKGPLRLVGGHVIMGATEPGTQLFNLTLVEDSTSAVVDWTIACLEITPPDSVFETKLPQPDADVTVPISGRPYRPGFKLPFTGGSEPAESRPVKDKRPIRVTFMGDLGRFDGMKRFMYMNLKYLPREDVEVSYLDLTCGGIGVMGELLMELGIPIFQHCVTCPSTVCTSAGEFYDFVTSLHKYNTIDQLPVHFQDMFSVLRTLFHDQDAIVLVCASQCVLVLLASELPGCRSMICIKIITR